MTISRVIAATVASSFNQNPSVSVNVGSGNFRKCRAWLGCSADSTPVPNTIAFGADSLTATGAQQTGPGTASMKWRLFESTSDLTVTGVQTVTGGLSAAPGSGASILLIEIYQGSVGTLTFGAPVFSNPESGSAGSISSNVTATTADKVVMLFRESSGSAITATSPGTLSGDLGATFAGSVMRDGLSGTTAVGAAFSGSYGVIAAAYTISEAGAAPVITGPSGAAGAASSTANLAEVATTGPTFTTDIALGGGYPTLTGADAASFAITALSSTSWRVDPVTPFNFESLPHSNPFSITFNASASVSQTCAITITNVNEAPGFSGTISVPGLTEGVAMSAINAALLFSDPDSGDTGTYSAVGTFPTGVTVSSGGLISGTPGAGTAATYSSLRVRRTDGGGLTADSNVFSITVSAAGAPPGVTTQPSNQTVTEGGVATFTAAFSNSPTGFAWEFADAPYSSWGPVVGGSGAALASYTTGALLLANNARRFRCTGTNAFGSTTTNGAAQVTVNAASGLAGFDFHSTVGCRFGAIAGSLVGLAPEVGVSIVIRVYNASTGALVATLPAAVTNSSGYLPRATHASLVAATSYTLNAVWPDGAVYAFNMVAT